MNSYSVPTSRPTTITITLRPLVASFRLHNQYSHRRHIYFSAVAPIMAQLESYGQVKPTDENGVYLLEVHPLVDWWSFIRQLEEINGLGLEEA